MRCYNRNGGYELDAYHSETVRKGGYTIRRYLYSPDHVAEAVAKTGIEDADEAVVAYYRPRPTAMTFHPATKLGPIRVMVRTNDLQQLRDGVVIEINSRLVWGTKAYGSDYRKVRVIVMDSPYLDRAREIWKLGSELAEWRGWRHEEMAGELTEMTRLRDGGWGLWPKVESRRKFRAALIIMASDLLSYMKIDQYNMNHPATPEILAAVEAVEKRLKEMRS